MVLFTLPKLPDFSARALLNIADQVIDEHRKYGPVCAVDIPLLIMKGILRWEEIKAEDPKFGLIEEKP